MSTDPEERYSHPPEDGRDAVLLTDHLEDVAARVTHIVPADATTPNGESLREVVRRLALVHDLGKATTWFQQYIGVRAGRPRSPPYRYHAPLGSFAAYAVLNAADCHEETCLAGFVAVAKHHGRLPDVTEYVYERTTGDLDADADRLDVLAYQAKDIHDDARDVATGIFEAATGNGENWTRFAQSLADDSLLSDIAGHVSEGGQELTDALAPSCYGLVLQCWSALVLADKTSAAAADRGEKTYAADLPDLATLDEHVDALQNDANPDPEGTREQRLNYCRARARSAVVENAESLGEDGGGVATLTLPTGMGKTLTGLSAAFTVRDALDGERVVYALPFTSVIDQVVADVQKIYDADLTGRLLTAHHHLENAVIESTPDDDGEMADRAEKNGDVARMLGEAWRAGLTVTTFVQFFESLAGPQNRQSLKLPALQNAVVVLDEPQSLPLDWWKLAPRLTDLLVDQYDATVIAMTATQPRMLRDGVESVDDVPELVDVDDYDYFDAVERVTYEFDDSAERYIETREDAKAYADAAAELRERPDDESVLAVTNTIDSARELTDAITDGGEANPGGTEFVDVAGVYERELAAAGDAEKIELGSVVRAVIDDGNRPFLHLSTRLRPVDRLNLVEIAKELTGRDSGLLVVSTQLIEAGVDISFDRVYRDLAPLDSIVQAAGRCNRSFERQRGVVTVWWLDAPDEESEKTPAEAVYNRGTSLLPVTTAALEWVREGVDELDETAVAKTAVEEFYERLGESGRDVGKREYADYVNDADADSLAGLSLIEQRRSADVLVTRTRSDRERVEALRHAYRTFEFEELSRLRDETKPIRISVPIYDDETEDAIRKLQPVVEEDALYQLDVRANPDHFDVTTGFTVPESTVAHQFL